jgi:hypothetical protein
MNQQAEEFSSFPLGQKVRLEREIGQQMAEQEAEKDVHRCKKLTR